MKKKLSPIQQDPFTAMLDKKGNLVTLEAGIKNVATEHYKNVLKNREIKDDLKEVKKTRKSSFPTDLSWQKPKRPRHGQWRSLILFSST